MSARKRKGELAQSLGALWKAERYVITAREALPGRLQGTANAGTPHEETIVNRAVPPLFDRLRAGVPAEFSREELIELVGGEEKLGSLFVDKRLEVEPIGKKGLGRRGAPRMVELSPEKVDTARSAYKLKKQGWTWPRVQQAGHPHRMTLLKYWSMLGLEWP